MIAFANALHKLKRFFYLKSGTNKKIEVNSQCIVVLNQFVAKQPQPISDKIMTEVLIALLTGMFVGVLFSLLKLPLPAPPVISGVVGIFGIYAGGQVYQWVVERFFS